MCELTLNFTLHDVVASAFEVNGLRKQVLGHASKSWVVHVVALSARAPAKIGLRCRFGCRTGSGLKNKTSSVPGPPNLIGGKDRSSRQQGSHLYIYNREKQAQARWPQKCFRGPVPPLEHASAPARFLFGLQKGGRWPVHGPHCGGTRTRTQNRGRIFEPQGLAAGSTLDESLYEKGIQVAHQCWPPQVRMKRSLAVLTAPSCPPRFNRGPKDKQSGENRQALLQQLFQAPRSRQEHDCQGGLLQQHQGPLLGKPRWAGQQLRD